MTSDSVAAIDELKFIIARLRWPTPSVRWWVMQELAQLILDEHTRYPTEQALLHDIALRQFETEAVEVLFVFWLAKSKNKEYVPPAELGEGIVARSPLSDQLLREICLGTVVLGKYSARPEVTPVDFEPTQDFIAAEGVHFPRALRSALIDLEVGLCKPLQQQFAFEWHTSKQRVAFRGQSIDFFLESPREQSTGQFFTQLSARARSAYLRTLLVAQEHWKLPQAIAERLSLVALPLDPSTAWLTSLPPSAVFPSCLPAPGVHQLGEFVRDALTAAAGDGVVGAMSWTTFISNDERVDTTLALWWGPSSVWPASLRHDEAANVYAGTLYDSGLNCGSEFVVPEYRNLPDATSGFRPLACRTHPSRYGYIQADLVSRGLFAPILHLQGTTVAAEPSGELLQFRADCLTLGHFAYWNTDWHPSHPKEIRPRLGAYLRLTTAGLAFLAGNSKGHLFYAWHCRHLSRASSYEQFTVTDTCGVMPWK